MLVTIVLLVRTWCGDPLCAYPNALQFKTQPLLLLLLLLPG
jgi:hypothetical protein